MTTLPDIPRLYTALAEWLACLLYVLALRRRFGTAVTAVISGAGLVLLGTFLQLTGGVPLAWWIPCMATAVAAMYLFLFGCCAVTPREAGYCCARAFILAEFAASLEWQLHCLLWPQRSGWELPALGLLLLVYAGVFGFVYWFEFRRMQRNPELGITRRALASAVIMAVAAFAVSNLAFTQEGQATLSVFTSARWWTWPGCWCFPSSRNS